MVALALAFYSTYLTHEKGNWISFLKFNAHSVHTYNIQADIQVKVKARALEKKKRTYPDSLIKLK